jgi:hypothetical protein
MIGNVVGFVKKHGTIAEISGSLGDLGTLLPIIVALSQQGQISLTATLVFGGIFNIIAGFYFGIPVHDG